MTKFKIESGVRLPAVQGRTSRYPFAEMQIGDSFFAPLIQPRTLYSAARAFARKSGKGTKFVVRKEGSGGARVWRTA